MKISYDNLLNFSQSLLKNLAHEFSLSSVALGLCETSLRGVDSHGIRLLPHYVESALKGGKSRAAVPIQPDFSIYWSSGCG